MRFEHILQVYWTKGFFYGGRLFYVSRLEYNNLFKTHLHGLGNKFKILLNKRLELTTFYLFTSKISFMNTYFNLYFKNALRTINIIFSQINNVNLTLNELKKN